MSITSNHDLRNSIVAAVLSGCAMVFGACDQAPAGSEETGAATAVDGDSAGVAVASVQSALRQYQLPYNPAQFSSSRGDFNGDGKKDLVFIGTAGSVDIRFSNGSNYNNLVRSLSAGAYGTLATGIYLVADFDGDRKDDLFFITNAGGVYVRRSDGKGGFYVAQKILEEGQLGAWSSGPMAKGQYFLSDANGDAKADLWFAVNDGRGLFLKMNNGNGFGETITIISDIFGNIGGKYFSGDYDGDKKADIFFVDSLGYGRVRASSGIVPYTTWLFGPAKISTASGNMPGEYRIGDFNGDGRSDFFYIGTGGDVWVYTANTKSDGTTWMHPVTKLLNAGAYGTLDSGQYYVGDYNGDGRSDLFFVTNDGAVYVRASMGGFFSEAVKLLNAGSFGTLQTGVYE